MNRRQFLQTMIAMPFLAVGNKLLGVDKMSIPSAQEAVMLIAKSIENGKLDDFDRDQLQLYLNPLDTTRNWIKQASSTPHFQHMEFGSARGDILPHECASLRFSTQSIADGTTPLTPTAADTSNAATWSNGMKLDVSNSKILFAGIPGQSIVGAFSWWLWSDASQTGDRHLLLNTTGGGSTKKTEAGLNHASEGTAQYVFNVRRMAAGEDDFNIQVWQDSGGAINGEGLLVVMRLR